MTLRGHALWPLSCRGRTASNVEKHGVIQHTEQLRQHWSKVPSQELNCYVTMVEEEAFTACLYGTWQGQWHIIKWCSRVLGFSHGETNLMTESDGFNCESGWLTVWTEGSCSSSLDSYWPKYIQQGPPWPQGRVLSWPWFFISVRQWAVYSSKALWRSRLAVIIQLIGCEEKQPCHTSSRLPGLSQSHARRIIWISVTLAKRVSPERCWSKWKALDCG